MADDLLLVGCPVCRVPCFVMLDASGEFIPICGQCLRRGSQIQVAVSEVIDMPKSGGNV